MKPFLQACPRRIAAMAAALSMLSGCAVPTASQAPLGSPHASKRQLDARIASEEPVRGTISLYEAMARALKYDLDHKIEIHTEILRQRQLELASYDLLPQLVASTGWNGRNNDAGARSRSLLSGRESLEPSTSSERRGVTSDITLSWDILDFGLSYVKAQQAADQRMIAQENRRKVVNRILEDVRTAYWRAVSADRTFRKLVDLEAQAQRAMRQAEELEERRIAPPLTVLNYQRDLLSVQAEVQRLQRELSLSKSQLAALMNLRPDAEFILELPDRTDLVPSLPGSADEMVLVGLKFRPELREIAYNSHLNQLEMRAAFLRTLPTVKALFGFNQDSNDYLYNRQWVGASARVSWNLMSVFKYPATQRALQADADLTAQLQLAMTMAIMTQVHVARVRFVRLSQEIDTISKAQAVQERIVRIARAGLTVRANSQQSLVREELNAILAEVRYDTAYAELQNAYANMYATMGLDDFGIDVTSDMPIAALSRSLHEHWTERAGSLPVITENTP